MNNTENDNKSAIDYRPGYQEGFHDCKYKKMWNELKDEVQWIGDEMVYNSMIEKEKELGI